MTIQGKSLELWAAKGGGVVVALSSLYGVAKDILNRSPSGPGPNGILRLYAVLILGIVVAIGYGLLWTAFEKLFGWQFGSGGKRKLPHGWSAVALSLSATLPLVILPLPYQRATGLLLIGELRPHLIAAAIVVAAGVLTHLLMYGAGKFSGLRRKIMPPQKKSGWRRAAIMELVFALVYFVSFVVPYRFIVERFHLSVQGTLVNRTAVPALAFFSGMVFFISVKSESLHEQRYVELRGFLSALLMMGCLCAGMFG
jgi:polyferredoxin